MKTEAKTDLTLAMRIALHTHVVRAGRVAVVALLPVAFGACSWFTDFKTQPSIEPWEPVSQNASDTTTPPRGQPRYSVPIQGTTTAAYAISYSAGMATIDSFSPIPNPVAADARSIANGRLYYQINCAVCHGMAGDANGGLKKVNPAYGFAPSLLLESAVGRSDGYLYGIIRNGRGVMPNYNRIEDADRWDVVNYLRALQKKTADTTLAGMPGQNGTTVPGPSMTAPTKPVPYVRPTVVNTPGSPGINSATFKGAEKAPAAAGKEKHE